MRKKNIILVGFMGVGKTAVIDELNKLYPDYRKVDTDELIVNIDERPISQIFEESGEDYFRTLETITLERVCREEFRIIATGGGIVLKPENRALLKMNGIVFWLNANPVVVYERIKDQKHRPLVDSSKSKVDVMVAISNLMIQRFDNYMQASDIMINTDELNIEQVAKAIYEEYERLKDCLI